MSSLAFERKTRLELATLTLARLCSTNWAISAIKVFHQFIISKRLCPEQDSNLHASRHTHLKRARLPIPPPGQRLLFQHFKETWAENETRTRDPNLGKVMLYQLSYFRIFSFAVAKVGIFRKPANILHTFFHRNLCTLPPPPNNLFDYQLIRSR